MSTPATGIATIAPPPSINSTMPSLASDRPRRAFANGTIGAHVAVATPQTRKIQRVARAAVRVWSAGRVTRA